MKPQNPPRSELGTPAKGSVSVLASAILATLMSGCTQWAEHGHGGFAEHDAAPHYPVEIPNLNGYKDESDHAHSHGDYSYKNLYTDDDDYTQYQHAHQTIDVYQALRLDIEIARNHLDSLILAGANICFPAAVYHLKLRQNRIEREMAGGLAEDASVDLMIQRKHLARLREQVRIASIDVDCNVVGPPKFRTVAQIKRIELLLNSDNQFTSDSANLNPKYESNLAQAADWLKDNQDISLIIEGHTDNTGNPTKNNSLGGQRAHAVAAHLTSLGINDHRITVASRADTKPYSFDDAPEDKLVNRRVTISLIEKLSHHTGPYINELSKGGL